MARRIAPEPLFTDTLELDMSIDPAVARRARSARRTASCSATSTTSSTRAGRRPTRRATTRASRSRASGFDLGNGDVVIAAITSCTNTSNPSVLVAAGLVARKARAKGLTSKPWVKTSLAPGSQVVTDYLNESGLSEDLNALGFDLVGYGCTTCIGNSGPLPEPISKAINENDLVAVSVLSGNRNFEGRVSPDCRANYLASPPLVVAYALKGTVRTDMVKEPIGTGSNGEPVYLKDIWPSNEEIRALIDAHVHSRDVPPPLRRRLSRRRALAGDRGHRRRDLRLAGRSTYIQNPPYFTGMTMTAAPPGDIDAPGRWRCSAIRSPPTTSRPPARSSPTARPGRYLLENGVTRGEFNSYGARRGNHEVMMRGTFANIRIRNRMLDNVEGGFTRYAPTGETMPIYDAAMLYKHDGTPLVIIAGKEYGTGSSRDWAAKGTSPARRPRRDRRELRAHPPLQPGRHGRASAAIPRRRECRRASASTGSENFTITRRRRHPAAPGRRGAGHARRTARSQLHGPLPDRYLQRARIFPLRRHPPLRAAEAGRA